MRPHRREASCLVVLLLSACGGGGLTQMQDSIARFDQGTHAAATAEASFLNAVYNADCNYAFYSGTADWAFGTAGNFDLTGTCKPTILDDAQVQSRQILMDAITLYADKMAALATADKDKSLDANSQKLAATLNGLATNEKLVAKLGVASAVEAGIVEIAKMALDQRVFSDVHAAAKAMSPHLQAIVALLQTENSTFAVGISSKMDGLQLKLRQVVATTRASRGAMSFFDVVAARQIVRTANPFSPNATAASAAVTPATDPQNVAVQLNATLGAVVNANNAIATAGTGGIIAAVNDLVARANDAIAIRNALNK